jgi:hypothetical protein
MCCLTVNVYLYSLYSVGDACWNEHEPMVEWWQAKTEVLAENMSQSYSVHHKSHGDWPRIQPKNDDER